jgi:cysteine synthase A
MEMAGKLWLEEGLPVGASAGAIVNAAITVMSRDEMAGKTAVVIIPSFGERYFTHPMFADMKNTAETMVKQALPEPFDNTLFGFATPRG